MNTVITSMIEFLDTLKKADTAFIGFFKKDKKFRIMRCTLNFDKIPETDHPKRMNLAKLLYRAERHRLLNVYDLDKHGWRSVPFESVIWLQPVLGLRIIVVIK